MYTYFVSTAISHGHNALQIVHDRGDHWIVASTVRPTMGDEFEQSAEPDSCNVCIYDSVFTQINSTTKDLLLQLFGEQAKIKIKQDFQRQNGGYDCGVFAIAVCTSLAYDSPLQFNQDTMRAHLLKCFKDLKLTPFP